MALRAVVSFGGSMDVTKVDSEVGDRKNGR